MAAPEIPPKFLLQMAHLTAPATVWKYVERACTASSANLVMLDLEDSIPRDRPDLLEEGRKNVVRAFETLDWGPRLRFFRPRGYALDPRFEDVRTIVEACGARIDGIVYPKVDAPEEVAALDAALVEIESAAGLPQGHVKLEILVESIAAEERAFAIAHASRRIVGLVFGAFDYWSSLGIVGESYRTDHPLVDQARGRIVKAAATIGVPAIAEMTINYPTKDKTDAERRAALEECRRDALYARRFGFRGKWTGTPAQVDVVLEVFTLADETIAHAVEQARRFREAERAGRGATILEGKMADRATDRVHRTVLRTAAALGKLDAETARELGLARESD